MATFQNLLRKLGQMETMDKNTKNLQHVGSAIPPSMGEYLPPPTQLELVGHSITLASYPFMDPYYGGIITAYGPQALVHPHLLTMHHTKLPLPLETTEEPVYVNAKQYHRILRRRQSRAKAEMEKKLIKDRKDLLQFVLARRLPAPSGKVPHMPVHTKGVGLRAVGMHRHRRMGHLPTGCWQSPCQNELEKIPSQF